MAIATCGTSSSDIAFAPPAAAASDGRSSGGCATAGTSLMRKLLVLHMEARREALLDIIAVGGR